LTTRRAHDEDRRENRFSKGCDPIQPPADLVDDIVAITQIPAPTFEEEERIAWLEQRLAGAPGRRARDAAGNLLWQWGDGRPELLLAAHVDTVFPRETELRVTRTDSRLSGPGIGDNAAAIAVTIAAVLEILGRSEPAPGGVAFTVAEEGFGSLRGAAAACTALQPKLFIAVEGHGLDRLIVDAVGSVRARIRVRGPGGHSWADRGRPSAIHGLLELGTALRGRSTPDAPVNVGVLAGGRSVNSIADDAELHVEARSLEEPQLEKFARALAALQVAPPLELDVEVLDRRPSGRLGREQELLRIVRDVRRELALPDALESGSTDANAALARGIPALALGVSNGADMHSPAESIELDSLALGLRQLETVVARVLT
jgi:acetylornithine deacetylase/succinyl-diaminopimelate desuccinylase-like protein